MELYDEKKVAAEELASWKARCFNRNGKFNNCNSMSQRRDCYWIDGKSMHQCLEILGPSPSLKDLEDLLLPLYGNGKMMHFCDECGKSGVVVRIGKVMDGETGDDIPVEFCRECITKAMNLIGSVTQSIQEGHDDYGSFGEARMRSWDS